MWEYRKLARREGKKGEEVPPTLDDLLLGVGEVDVAHVEDGRGEGAAL